MEGGGVGGRTLLRAPPGQPPPKRAGVAGALVGGLFPPPPPGYLEEKAQHEGQRPEAEAGAYLLCVHALVWIQAPLVLHLLQLRGRGQCPEPAGELAPLHWRPGHPQVGDALTHPALQLQDPRETPAWSSSTPCPPASWREARTHLHISSQRGAWGPDTWLFIAKGYWRCGTWRGRDPGGEGACGRPCKTPVALSPCTFWSFCLFWGRSHGIRILPG